MPKNETFAKALYTFDIGQNDLSQGLFTGMSIDEIKQSLSGIVNSFTAILKNLHNLIGARTFWIHSIGPLGCYPYILTIVPTTEFDSVGCSKAVNELSQSFNSILKAAPVDVVVPPGNTGLDPSQTSFFQVLNIPTKFNKGIVEITTNVDLIKKGDKVGSTEAALLEKLGLRPFSYGLIVKSAYDNGSVLSPEILELTKDDIALKFVSGLANVASVVLSISYPSIAATPCMFTNAYKNVLDVSEAADYTYKQAEKLKEFLKD